MLEIILAWINRKRGKKMQIIFVYLFYVCSFINKIKRLTLTLLKDDYNIRDINVFRKYKSNILTNRIWDDNHKKVFLALKVFQKKIVKILKGHVLF